MPGRMTKEHCEERADTLSAELLMGRITVRQYEDRIRRVEMAYGGKLPEGYDILDHPDIHIGVGESEFP